ncbi:hypothetical protein Fmac_003217 [Flemingia macrophylla]|uniref:Uncharacterized protein n=1 Tax=Flemingia macrophylla TaxID=520843 RepID=A0ABD1NNL1_9FABA
MGRMPCCEKVGLNRGPWTSKEDKKLSSYVQKHGHGNWRSLPAKAGLLRCGKSCRLRWINYLKPDIKRGDFTFEEDCTILRLHALLGNKWSTIASQLPNRTDNDIKNYWNTNIKKRLISMGLDPITHQPAKANTLENSGGEQSKVAINMNHIAQWETVRLEAEARESKSSFFHSPDQPVISKIHSQPQCSRDPHSTELNTTTCNMYALMLSTNPCFQSQISMLSSPKLPIPTNARQCTDSKSSLSSYKGFDDEVIETSDQTQIITEECVPNWQDDDIMVAVEAFKTARYESIQEILTGPLPCMEGLINDSVEIRSV